jgi:hypothetical protein
MVLHWKLNAKSSESGSAFSLAHGPAENHKERDSLAATGKGNATIFTEQPIDEEHAV